MKKIIIILVCAGLAIISGTLPTAFAMTVTDDFTGISATNPWVPLGDACLTAGNGTGTIPACSTQLAGLGLPSSATTAAVGAGALMLSPNVNNKSGAIIFPTEFPSTAGLTITFNTYTFGGNRDSGGAGNVPNNKNLTVHSGADGIGFYLIDANKEANTSNQLSSTFRTGAFGGSLGYDCSNKNKPFNGMTGGYLGLGIDEFGNFVNSSDNSQTGPGFAPNSIAMRGYGDVNQDAIAAALGLAPSRISTGDVQQVCKGGGDVAALRVGGSTKNAPPLPDYAYIPGSFVQLPASELIANENAQAINGPTAASSATPISYKLTLTPAGLLSLSYSYNNGSYIQVLNNQSITATNGPMPNNFFFGFGASTGGGNNFHDITCFQAAPANQSNSSASANVQQSGEVRTDTQVYLAYYSPSNWWGRLTAQLLQVNPTSGQITVDPVATWDASCVLTGGACTSTGNTGTPAAVNPYTTNTIPVLSWSGSAGIPFVWSGAAGGLTSTEQGWLNGGGNYVFGQDLVQYLDGSTAYDATGFNAANTTTAQFRTRTNILGDIVDSSPVWVGGPGEALPTTFSDALYPTQALPENAANAQTYPAYTTADSGRNNVVYVGANDGMLHGFQTGSYSGATFNSATNNGQEVLSYVPYAVLQDFNGQTNTASDYAYPGYGHNFYDDATVGTGDIFYNGTWHTWLVSGLGTGGRGLFALDVNNPSNFSEANAGSLVVGDYTFANPTFDPTGPSTPGTFLGVNVTGVDSYQATAGDISGIPIIRLMNNGDYAIISGNGAGSDNGEAGIYVMLVDPTTGAISQTYFLGTGAGTSAGPDGIEDVAAADLNGDHFVSYVYAGDLLGNVWRFNLTSQNPANWHVSTYGNGTGTPTPLFTTPAGQPITTQVLVNSDIAPDGVPQVMVQFGTGQETPLTNVSSATYAPGQQAIYGVWDWDMGGWDALPGAKQYASLPRSSVPTLLTLGNLEQQTVTSTGTTQNTTTPVNGEVISSNQVCWDGSATTIPGCGAYNQFGWYLNLSSYTPTNSSTALYEQIIYSPTFTEGAVVFNTAIPPYVNAQVCATGLQTGYTMAFNPLTGGAPADGFFRTFGNSGVPITLVGGAVVDALQLNATGSSSTVVANGSPVLVQQTTSGNPVVNAIFPAGGAGSEVNWIELR